MSSPRSWSQQRLHIPHPSGSSAWDTHSIDGDEQRDRLVHPPIWRIVIPDLGNTIDSNWLTNYDNDESDEEDDRQLLLAPSTRRYVREHFHVDVHPARTAFQRVPRDVLQELLGNGSWNTLESDSELEFVQAHTTETSDVQSDDQSHQ